jgi:hypothetical protein
MAAYDCACFFKVAPVWNYAGGSDIDCAVPAFCMLPFIWILLLICAFGKVDIGKDPVIEFSPEQDMLRTP